MREWTNMVKKLGFLIGLTFAAPWCAAAVAPDIPSDFLAYPVQIIMSSSSGSGSGFYVDTSSFAYLVTARHVIYDLLPMINPLPERISVRDKRMILRSYSHEPDDKESNILNLDLEQLVRDNRVKFSSEHDVAVVQLMQFDSVGSGDRIGNLVRGAETLHHSKAGLFGKPLEWFLKFSDVVVGNQVFMFGYPSSIGLSQIPQIDYEKPLLKNGIIAGKNERLKTVILDCAVYPGDSGGPVLEVDRNEYTLPVTTIFRPIGVVSQYVPYVDKNQPSNIYFANSGYAVVEPIDDVINLIRVFEK
jgi:hypothetical protein